jgi:tetratricopeptide (TPR) repeat protein
MQGSVDMHQIEERLQTARIPSERLAIISEEIGRFVPVDLNRATELLEEGFRLAKSQRKRGEGRLEHAKLLQASGVRYSMHSQHDLAQREFEAALSLFQKLSDKKGIAGTILLLGAVRAFLSEYEKAEKLFERAKNLFQEMEDRSGEARSLTRLAGIQSRTGKYVAAASTFASTPPFE